jgi:hypothetical protein
MNRVVVFIISLFVVANISAQEVLINCGNTFLKDYSQQYFSKEKNKVAMIIDTLELPFFDDFANSFVYPDSSKWIDKFAFVNTDFAIDLLTIGVATLDAINEFGVVYTHLPSLSSGVADYLTSKPINLNYAIEDSIYLSFYYQAGGYGNSPELRDSLVLQFSTPDTAWHSVWNIGGGAIMDSFKLVMIPIRDEYLLKKGFQFRFLNYASLSTNYEPSWISNTDHWNIDYIKIDTARMFSDTLANDVAFIKNFSTMLLDYESVPWNHYKQDTANLINDTLNFIYKNSWDDTYNINRQVEIVDLYGTDAGFSMLDDSENILPFETIEYNRNIPYVFNSDSQDSAKFMIKGFLKTDLTANRHMYRWNDTIRYYQNFSNYYAYDDGTAEKGYGITGQGTANASLAYQFVPLVSDTLRGVNIFFNQVLNEGNRKYFYLTVWADNNGIPGDTLFQKVGVIPEYSDEINGFLYYPLDTALFIDTTFYVGWVKTTDDMLNAGFDLNRKSNNHVFYNVSGEWVVSQIEGALMVRPVFGKDPMPDISEIKPIVTKCGFELYPNPATDYLNISSALPFEGVDIFDSIGKLIFSGDNSESINIESFPSGLYFVKLRSKVEVFETKRFLIVR